MSAPDHTTASQSHQVGFPWQYVIGFILSLILTAIPLWMVLDHVAAPTPLVIGILIAAILQIFVQLFMFMHFTHGDGSGPAYHVLVLSIGFFFVIIFVGASIWIMSFHSVVQ